MQVLDENIIFLHDEIQKVGHTRLTLEDRITNLKSSIRQLKIKFSIVDKVLVRIKDVHDLWDTSNTRYELNADYKELKEKEDLLLRSETELEFFSLYEDELWTRYRAEKQNAF
jgi:hypothetical protein